MIKMFKGTLRAFKAIKKNDIYITHVEVVGGLSLTIDSIDTNNTRKKNNRLSHVSVMGLKFLNVNGVFGKDQVYTCPFVIIVCLKYVVGRHFHLVYTRHLKC